MAVSEHITFTVYKDSFKTDRVIFCYLTTTHDGLQTDTSGVAICATCDDPNNKLGKKIALGRARKAFNTGIHGRIFRSPQALAHLQDCGVPVPQWRYSINGQIVVSDEKTA